MTEGSRRASFQKLTHAKPDLTPEQARRVFQSYPSVESTQQRLSLAESDVPQNHAILNIVDGSYARIEARDCKFLLDYLVTTRVTRGRIACYDDSCRRAQL